MTDPNTQSVSESENPGMPSPEPAPHRPRTNKDWWPNQLDLSVLHQHSSRSNPLDAQFGYKEAFQGLDVEALKRDVIEVMTTSQDWWPADHGHYGGLFIRMSWHAAGTYRIEDGRGGGGQGAQRFAPLNSWPDNANLDKARRLLWPVKQKYGQKISWADLLVFAGNCALESMGFETFGFGFGRDDIWEPEEIFWGPEDTWLGDERYSGDRELTGPFGAVQMGLIYVNPEGPNGRPDPLASARDIRETFGRMAMNDEETVALIAGGHTFGKTHGAADAEDYVGPSRRVPRSRSRASAGRTASAAARAATPSPAAWRSPGLDADPVGQRVLREPVPLRVGADREPRRREAVGREGRREHHPRPGDQRADAPSHHAHDGPGAARGPDLRADLPALPGEPGPVRRRLRAGLVQAAAPRHGSGLAVPRPLGAGAAAVAGPRSPGRPRADRRRGHRRPQGHDPRLRPVDPAAGVDRVGLGVELPQHRLPRRCERGADPARAAAELGGQRAGGARHGAGTLEEIQQAFNLSQAGRKVSLADLIVLGGCAAVEQAARNAGHDISVPFAPGRTDASQEQTDVETFRVLEPTADGFRNYSRPGEKLPLEVRWLDRAYLLSLTAPEAAVLVGGLRVLEANAGQTRHGVFTDRPGPLTNDFFVNLLDLSTEWKQSAEENVYECRDRATGDLKWTATAVDLVFGAHSQLRAISEVYAQSDAGEKFVRDFVAAWDRVMNLDRFDLR